MEKSGMETLFLGKLQLTMQLSFDYGELSCQLKGDGIMFNEFKEKTIGRRISILFRLCMGHLRREMKALGFGAGDYAFLAAVFAHPGLSQDELSREVRVDKSYTARALARLEKLDLIQRLPDPEHHRVKRVYPTPRGREIEEEFFQILLGVHGTLTQDMDEGQVQRIRNDLDQMIHNMEMALPVREGDK